MNNMGNVDPKVAFVPNIEDSIDDDKNALLCVSSENARLLQIFTWRLIERP